MEKFDKTFVFDGSTNIRCVTKDGKPWFVADDVCVALGVNRGRQAVSSLDDDEKGGYSIATLGGNQTVTIVSEGGLYTLILRSRKATTPGTIEHRFRRWVTHEVIPSIRETGSYSVAMKMLSDLLEVNSSAANACVSFYVKQDRVMRVAKEAAKRTSRKTGGSIE